MDTCPRKTFTIDNVGFWTLHIFRLSFKIRRNWAEIKSTKKYFEANYGVKATFNIKDYFRFYVSRGHFILELFGIEMRITYEDAREHYKYCHAHNEICGFG